MPLLQTKRGRKTPARLIKRLFDSPIRLIVTSFAVVIVVGSLLLSLPIASVRATSYLTALFTATSATCVTGLVVVDTASHFTAFGQGVILLLIQIGGLGLATITTFFFSVLSKNRSWKLLDIERETTGSGSAVNPRVLLGFIMKFTAVVEALGALILAWRFWPRYGVAAIWRGVFQSVSAFCNAGFDLHGTKAAPFVSLAPFAHDPIVLITTAFLFMAGGLGFIVWREVLTLYKETKPRHLSFHVKVVLIGTAIALIGGALFFWYVERTNMNAGALGRLAPSERPLAAFFQSATTRTAGFNVLNQSTMTESSRVVSALLMFVGAAPAGTAGGIKLTTLAVTIAVAFSGLKTDGRVRLGAYHIKRNVVARTVTIFFFALGLVLAATLAISIIEQRFHASLDTSFVDNLFEASSAFGTVGLSSVGTIRLHLTSRLILMILMFIGRVGPASFAISFMRRESSVVIVRPEGNVIVG